MPLVQRFKTARIFKRSARLKGRPAWQDVMPDSQAGRDAYVIAAKYEDRFSRAFLKAMRELITEADREPFIEAWRKQSVVAIENALPFFDYGEIQTDNNPIWSKFMSTLSGAYKAVIDAAGKDATRLMNKKFKINVQWTMDAGEGQTGVVQKAELTAADMMVPVNPYSVKWINDQSLGLVENTITLQQKDVLQDILTDALERGVRPTSIFDSIMENIGLTRRGYRATLRRRAMLEEAGFAADEVESRVGKYRQKLLKARAHSIARTETIRAQAQGRRAVWQIAQDGGQLPEVKRVWMSPPTGPNPQAPCPICLGLDGTEAKLNESYQSDVIGPVEGPPAHPNCRCTEIIERVEPKS